MSDILNYLIPPPHPDANGNYDWVRILAGQPSALTGCTMYGDLDMNGFNILNIGNFNLNSLSDVTVTAPTTGQVLAYNGVDWSNVAPPQLNNTANASPYRFSSNHIVPLAGNFVFLNAALNSNELQPVLGGTIRIWKSDRNGLVNSSLANLVLGERLAFRRETGSPNSDAFSMITLGGPLVDAGTYYNITGYTLGPASGLFLHGERAVVQWFPSSPVPPIAFNDLTDVNVPAPANNDLVRFNAGIWSNISYESYLPIQNLKNAMNAGRTLLAVGSATPSGTEIGIGDPAVLPLVSSSVTKIYIPNIDPVSGYDSRFYYDFGTQVGDRVELSFTDGLLRTNRALFRLTSKAGTTAAVTHYTVSFISGTGTISVGQSVTIKLESTASIANTGDVTITGPVNGEVLTYQAGNWVNQASGGSSAKNYGSLFVVGDSTPTPITLNGQYENIVTLVLDSVSADFAVGADPYKIKYVGLVPKNYKIELSVASYTSDAAGTDRLCEYTFSHNGTPSILLPVINYVATNTTQPEHTGCFSAFVILNPNDELWVVGKVDDANLPIPSDIIVRNARLSFLEV